MITLGGLYSLTWHYNRSGFDWTGIPIVIAGPDGSIEYEAEYVRSIDNNEDFIQLVPKLQEFEIVGYVRKLK